MQPTIFLPVEKLGISLHLSTSQQILGLIRTKTVTIITKFYNLSIFMSTSMETLGWWTSFNYISTGTYNHTGEVQVTNIYV